MLIDSNSYTHIHTKENKMSDMTKQFEQFAELFKTAMPQVKPNKNGYEIRTKILDMAQQHAWQDYYAKWGMFEASMTKEMGELVTKVTLPEVPGTETVLDAAQKFYDFVSGKPTNGKSDEK